MSIRNISIDSPYGDAIQGTVAEIEKFCFLQDPCTQNCCLCVKWKVYNTISDALDGCKPVVEAVHETKGDSFVVLGEVNVDFNELREAVYNFILANYPEYAGGTKHYEVMP